MRSMFFMLFIFSSIILGCEINGEALVDLQRILAFPEICSAWSVDGFIPYGPHIPQKLRYISLS